MSPETSSVVMSPNDGETLFAASHLREQVLDLGELLRRHGRRVVTEHVRGQRQGSDRIVDHSILPFRDGSSRSYHDVNPPGRVASSQVRPIAQNVQGRRSGPVRVDEELLASDVRQPERVQACEVRQLRLVDLVEDAELAVEGL